MTPNSGQLEMTFAPGENTFKNNLDKGIFTLLIEHDSPGADIAPEEAGRRLVLLDQAVQRASEIMPTGLAITDQYNFSHSHRAAEYAGALPPERRNAHLIYLSGRETTFERMVELIQLCRNAGIRNLVPVSGDFHNNMTRNVFTEDVRTIKWIKENYPDASPGAVVNPYKYRADTQFAQFFKLIKKLKTGSGFVVTQAGWDMRKLQALKWYMEYRNLDFPVIARLMLLTPRSLEQIRNGAFPGITVSPDFEAILHNELAFSAKQFEAAQWRRLELQAAGCKFLGFSGIQISGVDTPDKIRLTAMRIKAALREFSSFEQWVEEYCAYQAKAEMAPTPNSFMMFEGLLSRQYFDPTVRFCRNGLFSNVKMQDRLLYFIKSMLFKHCDGQRPSGRRILKKILAGCSGCGQCRLHDTAFICTEKCPKKLANGPCGGVRQNGRCEISSAICVHSRITAIREWQHDPDKLEDLYVPANDEF